MRTIAWFATGLMLLAGSSAADVLYDNFGPGDSYRIDAGLVVSSGPSRLEISSGLTFTVSGGNYYLDSIVVAMSNHIFHGDNRATFKLFNTIDGQPGVALDTAQAGGFGPFYRNNPVSTALFSGSTLLEQGHQYFVVAYGAGDTFLSWNQNDQGALGNVWQIEHSPWHLEPDEPSPAARIHGTPVPGPSTFATVSIVAMLQRRRRGR